MRKSIGLGIAAAVATILWTGARANDDKGHGMDAGHVVVRADELKWGPPPPGLPAGIQVAIVAGDPGKPGPFVMRAKMPDGYKVPPHSHLDDENVTVLHGTLMAGKGDKLTDPAVSLSAGSFVRMPKGMHHFVWAKGETVIQIHGTGPFEIIYVNPADDPRKK
jgi:quercetin dioxygenase-like cupin family protein